MPRVGDIQDDPGTSYSARKYGSAEKTNQTHKNTDTNDGSMSKGHRIQLKSFKWPKLEQFEQ